MGSQFSLGLLRGLHVVYGTPHPFSVILNVQSLVPVDCMVLYLLRIARPPIFGSLHPVQVSLVTCVQSHHACTVPVGGRSFSFGGVVRSLRVEYVLLPFLVGE